MLKVALNVLLILVGINCLSFVVARLWWYLHGTLAAKLVVRESTSQSRTGKSAFLIAGTLNQAEAAFEFAKPYVADRRQVYLQFKMIGWDAYATAEAIARDLVESGDVLSTIYTISVGEHVAYHLRNLQNSGEPSTRLNFISINPCPTRDAVQKRWRWMLVAGTPVFELVCHALGWISIVPVIPTAGGKFSLMTLADQFWATTYDDVSHMPIPTVSKVVLSSEDELLDNDFLREYLQNAEIVLIPTHHGDTIGAAEHYIEAMEKLELSDKTTNFDEAVL